MLGAVLTGIAAPYLRSKTTLAQREAVFSMVSVAVTAAKRLLDANLPKRESDAVYYHDCEKESLLRIGECRLFCEEFTVKKYRQGGYFCFSRAIVSTVVVLGGPAACRRAL